MKKPLTELERAMQARERKKKLRVDRAYDSLGMETPDQWKARYEREQDEAYKAVPIEAKQKFLDLFNQGIPLGKAAEMAGIDSMIAAQVIVRNAVQLTPTKVRE